MPLSNQYQSLLSAGKYKPLLIKRGIYHSHVSSLFFFYLQMDKKDNATQENDGKVAEKKLVRKLDTRLLPFLSFMYLFSSLDRSSLGIYS